MAVQLIYICFSPSVLLFVISLSVSDGTGSPYQPKTSLWRAILAHRGKGGLNFASPLYIPRLGA